MAVFEIISISSSWSYNLESKSTYSPRPKVALSKIEFDKKILNVTEFSFFVTIETRDDTRAPRAS